LAVSISVVSGPAMVPTLSVFVSCLHAVKQRMPHNNTNLDKYFTDVP